MLKNSSSAITSLVLCFSILNVSAKTEILLNILPEGHPPYTIIEESGQAIVDPEIETVS